MTFAYREMQHMEMSVFFRLEFACQSPTHQFLNDLLIFVMGTPCQKT